MKKSKIILYSLPLIILFILLHIFFPPFLPSLVKIDIDRLFFDPISNWYLIFEFIGLMILLGFVIYFGVHFLASFGTGYRIKSKYIPDISILIASKDEKLPLKRTLNSIIQCEYPKDKMEIIVITSGSTDDSAEFCVNYAEDHSNIKIKVLSKSLEVKGKPAALNYGLENIENDVCVFYDSGNIIGKDGINKLINPLNKNNQNVAMGPVLVENWNENKWTRGNLIDYSLISGGGIISEIKNRLGSSCYLFGRNFCIRTKLIKELGGFKEDSLTADLFLSTLLNLNSEKIQFVPNARIYDTVPKELNIIKKQRIRWILGLKNDSPILMKIHKEDKNTVLVLMSRSLSLILLANIDVWVCVMSIFLVLFLIISEFYLFSWTISCIIFSLGLIINGIRKYGDKHYSAILWLPASIYIHLYMLTRNFSKPKEYEWEVTRINLDDDN
ncbi:MAG: glycosyltransferase family 2 protein [Promethearchaeota archaeon]|nr:MAG: glycosyltransferase family 2 protein [Candidatus Lokiarchaeota archaeon]